MFLFIDFSTLSLEFATSTINPCTIFAVTSHDHSFKL
jgi:hypothetical protein